MPKKRLLIWGTGGHAKVVVDTVRLGAEFEIVGFIADPAERGDFHGMPVLGGEADLLTLRDRASFMLIAVGDCHARLRLGQQAKAAGFELGSAVHPKAIIAADVKIGAGTIVVAGVVVNPGTNIGASVILNTGCTVDHDCSIHDGVHVGPGVHLAGHVEIGRGAWLGIGSVAKEGIKVGPGSIVGAGAVLVHNIPPNVVAYGVPARVTRHISPS